MLRTTVDRAFDAALADPTIIDQAFYGTLVTQRQTYLSVVLTHVADTQKVALEKTNQELHHVVRD